MIATLNSGSTFSSTEQQKGIVLQYNLVPEVLSWTIFFPASQKKAECQLQLMRVTVITLNGRGSYNVGGEQ